MKTLLFSYKFLFVLFTTLPLAMCSNDDDSDPVIETSTDNDGDGIVNADDECPNEAGTLENSGCPETTGGDANSSQPSTAEPTDLVLVNIGVSEKGAPSALAAVNRKMPYEAKSEYPDKKGDRELLFLFGTNFNEDGTSFPTVANQMPFPHAKYGNGIDKRGTQTMTFYVTDADDPDADAKIVVTEPFSFTRFTTHEELTKPLYNYDNERVYEIETGKLEVKSLDGKPNPLNNDVVKYTGGLIKGLTNYGNLGISDDDDGVTTGMTFNELTALFEKNGEFIIDIVEISEVYGYDETTGLNTRVIKQPN